MSESAEYLASLASRIRESAPDLAVLADVAHGAAVDGIANHARDRDIDLIVMATHGRGPFRRAWLGSVADGVIRTSDTPVLLLRPPAGERPSLGARPPFPHVLIPIDGSVAARQVFADAVALAGPDAAFTLLRSVGVGTETHAGSEPRNLGGGALVPDTDGVAASILATAESELRALGVEHVDSIIVHGRRPAELIVEFSDMRVMDLIAMSTRGEGGIARLFLGSVADKVARSASCPVLLHRGHGAPE
jgi:nucleotide-binding universal stress UspA family protein